MQVRAACGMIKIFNEIFLLTDHGREHPFDDSVGSSSLYEVILEYTSSSQWKILNIEQEKNRETENPFLLSP